MRVGCGGIHVLKYMPASISIRSAGPRFIVGNFLAAVISGAALSVVSVGVEDEDGTVFEGDFDWLSGWEALVEQVETQLRIVVWDPFADGLPRRFDGFEGFDVEGRVRRWREVDDALPQSVEAEEELDFTGADDGADALQGGGWQQGHWMIKDRVDKRPVPLCYACSLRSRQGCVRWG